MSTARTTPAQNPRGLTLSSTFPFVSFCIAILKCNSQTLYHTSHSARVHVFRDWKYVMRGAEIRGYRRTRRAHSALSSGIDCLLAVGSAEFSRGHGTHWLTIGGARSPDPGGW